MDTIGLAGAFAPAQASAYLASCGNSQQVGGATFRKLSRHRRVRKIALITTACTTLVASAIALPFLFMQPGFTQEVLRI
jgi:hypothetical protein